MDWVTHRKLGGAPAPVFLAMHVKGLLSLSVCDDKSNPLSKTESYLVQYDPLDLVVTTQLRNNVCISAQGAGMFRNGMNGVVSNVFYQNNQAALNGGGLYMVWASQALVLCLSDRNIFKKLITSDWLSLHCDQAFVPASPSV
jgi:hypothetical protein